MTGFWLQIGLDERTQLRNYVLNYLANQGPQLEGFVIDELISLLCCLIKLGWNDGDTYKSIVDDISRFLDASEDHCIIGLQVLTCLVTEMNVSIPNLRRTITHSQSRKISLNFRDLHLLKIFNASLQMLSKVIQTPSHNKLRYCTIRLAHACLSFDFVGSVLDESNEDVGTLHPPSTWHTVVEDPNTVNIFIDVYKSLCTTDSVQSSTALECLVQLVSMRRTLFTSDESRILNITRHIQGTLEILSTQAGLDDHYNYHQFCRWLARLKVNYQLDEIIGLDLYPQWIELISNFTLQSLASDWTWIGESLYYLLSLWSKLVSAVPYSKSGKETFLERYVLKIVEQYISSRLLALSQAVDDNDDDDGPPEHLEMVPSIIRLQYERSAAYLITLMDPMLENYKVFASNRGVGANPVEVSKLETELAWLTRVIGSILTGRMNSTTSESQELIDGDLSARVFQLMIYTVEADSAVQLNPGILSTRLASPTGRARNTKGAHALDDAIVDFAQSFRRAFIGEEAIASNKVYVKLAERLGMSDSLVVLDVIASKIACNLRIYGIVDGVEIISKSLTLLQDLASGYSSSRLLCKLPTIREMLSNHDEDNFPFMKGPDSLTGRHRTTFYQTLLRILFANSGSSFEAEPEFIQFLEPLDRKLKLLAGLPSKEAFLADAAVKSAVVGVLRDLRGVVSTIANRKMYMFFFDWLYESHVSVLLKICEVFSEAGATEVTNVLLKFYAELVFNKSQRIVFDSSSPNGILLFKETSKIIVTYGRYSFLTWERAGGPGAVMRNSSFDAYRTMYKGIWVCMLMLSRALAGNYVNFGIFALYNDPTFKDVLEITLQLMMVIPVEQIMAFPKVAKAHFALLDILTANHTKEIVALEHSKFRRIMESLREGLQSYEAWLSTQCSCAIDQLSVFRFKQKQKGTGVSAAQMEAHVGKSPDLFPSCLSIIFNLIVNIDCTNQWSLSRPLLSLILTNTETFVSIEKRTVEAQPGERRMAVGVAFQNLMADIRPSLDSKNRDMFTSHVTQFRNALKTEGVTELVTG